MEGRSLVATSNAFTTQLQLGICLPAGSLKVLNSQKGVKMATIQIVKWKVGYRQINMNTRMIFQI